MRPADYAKADLIDHIELYSCEKTSGLVEEIRSKTQAPVTLIINCVLSTYSTLCQPLIDVEMIEGESCSVSLFALIVAGSGEGKSTVLKYTQAPIMKFEDFLASEYEQKHLEFSADKEIHKIKEKSLRKDIKRCLNAGKNDELSHLRKELVLLNKSLKEPVLKKLLVEDITPEALAHDLANGSGTLTLSSSEGNTILNGRVSNGLSFLNKAWGAEQYSVDRRGAKSFLLSDYRLTVVISTQPSTVSQFLKKKGELAIDSGLMARFLVCQPASTQGTRRRNSFDIEEKKAYTNYLKQSEALLRKEHSSHLSGKKERYLVKFSPEARVRWFQLCADIEAELQIGGRFQFARGHGSKIPEQVARVAAILTYIEYGETRDIYPDILSDAITIVRYSSDTYIRLFQSYPEHIQDAHILEEYLQGIQETGQRYVKKNRILQSGPSRLRNKSRLHQALDVLKEKNFLSICHANNGLVVLDLQPQLAPCKMAWCDFAQKNHINIFSPPGV